MKNVPVSVRAALNRRGRQDILTREGDYSQYEAEIQKIIHGNAEPQQQKQPLVPDMGDRYEEELTPEESKAQDRIEELGKQYGGSVEDDLDEDKKPLHVQSLENQVAKNPDYKKIADSITDNPEINKLYFDAFKDAYENNGGWQTNKFTVAQRLEDEYWDFVRDYKEKHGLSKKQWDSYGGYKFKKEYGDNRDFVKKGMEAHNKYFDELDKPNKGKQSFEESENNNYESDLDELDELYEEYDLNDEIIDNKVREVLDEEQMKNTKLVQDVIRNEFGVRSSFDAKNIADRWMKNNSNNYKTDFDLDEYVKYFEDAGYEHDEAAKKAKFKSENDQLLNKLENMPNEKQPSERDQDIAKIQAITDRINSYDADSAEGYLTTDESKLIKDLAQKHKLTADDLKKIGGRTFSDAGYGTDKFAYKEQSPEEQKESVNKELRESLKLPGDIVEDLKLSDEQYKILNEWLLKTKRM